MLSRVAILGILTLALLPVTAWAGPHPECTCEFCVENPDAKCRPPGGGVANCITLIRSGACLDTETETAAVSHEAPDVDRADAQRGACLAPDAAAESSRDEAPAQPETPAPSVTAQPSAG